MTRNVENELHNLLSPFNTLSLNALPTARNLVTKSMEGMGLDRVKYCKQYADLFLARLRENIDSDPLNNWILDKHTNRLHLTHKSGSVTVRFLKKTQFGNGVPHAGRNISRKHAWFQPKLETSEKSPGLFDDKLVNIIIAWEDDGERIISTAYHPINKGKYKEGAPYDFSIPLGLDETEYANLSFSSEPQNEILIPEANKVILVHN